jgi:hypothetical protein
MRIESQQSTYKSNQQNPKFKGFSDLMMDNVFLNKAMFDLTGSDIPWVVMANNKEERRERLNRAILSVVLVFVSPILILPLANRFAMNKVAKLTPNLFSKNYNAVRLSNKFLGSAKDTEKGLKELSKQNSLSNELRNLYYKYIKRKPIPEEKIDLPELLKSVDRDYDKLRKKIATAKSIVLGTDLFLIAAPFGHIGFYNNWQTEKKTGQIGYSAELKMADKEVVEKRAAKFKRNEKIRYGTFLASLVGLVVGLPIAVRHGLVSKNSGKFNNFVKKIGEKFDYKDAIFMNRLPMLLSFIGAHIGVFMASRNNTERKDNIIRSSTAISIFFLGDLLLSSILGRASDGLTGTKTLKRKEKGSWFNRLLPPMKDLQELKATKCPNTMRNAKIIFWTNFIFLSGLSGVIMPSVINKIIKKDVQQDADKAMKQ